MEKSGLARVLGALAFLAFLAFLGYLVYNIRLQAMSSITAEDIEKAREIARHLP